MSGRACVEVVPFHFAGLRHAAWWIRQGIQAGLRRRDCIRIPDGAGNGRSLQRVIVTVQLDAAVAESLSQIGEKTGLEYALHGMFVRVTGDALADLPARERGVLILRFGLFGDHERTLSEVATIIGVTRERVRQIEQRALRRLRIGPKSTALAALIDEP